MFYVHLSPLGKANKFSPFSGGGWLMGACIWLQKPVLTLLTYFTEKKTNPSEVSGNAVCACCAWCE